jgi:general secretion pathway protein I
MNRRGRQGGFTLLEVMISLAILAGGLTLMLGAAASNVEQALRAQMLGVATDLARAKMYDIENELVEEGFQELEQTFEGNFADEGWPKVTFEAVAEKVEMPNLSTLQAAQGAASGEGAGDGDGDGAESGGGVPNILSGAGSSESNLFSMVAGGSLIASQYELVSNILERSIRRVTLTVTWKVGAATESMKVVCYFTNAQGIEEAGFGGPGGPTPNNGPGQPDPGSP